MKLRYAIAFVISFIAGTTLFAQEKIHTCINEKGEKLFSIKAYWAGNFSNGMADVQRTVLENGKPSYRYGFIDETGKDVIECIYDKVYAFAYGVAWVKLPGSDMYYLINKKGQRVSDTGWKKVGYFFEGMCAVYNDEDKMGFVNRNGKLVIPCQYLGDSFSEGMACVQPYEQVEAKYGFIDTTGKLVIPYQYKQAGTTSFQNGECRVQINGVTCLINKKGEVIFKPTLTKNSQGFTNGLSASYTNATNRSGWGYYNRKNQWVIKPQYENANVFESGFAIVTKAKKEGVIDTTGKAVIPIKYATVFGSATDGYFGVELTANGTKEYLRPNGKPFAQIPILYLYPSNGHSLYPYTDKDNKYGYLNKDGSVFLQAQFERAGTFYEGKAWVRGNTDALKKSAGVSNDAFVKEYVVGEKVRAKNKIKGDYFPGTVQQIGEHYYLILFDDNTQEWVTFSSIKR
jgi:hypothetical protein